MKKLTTIVLFLMLFTSNANAGFVTFVHTASTRSAVRRAENTIEETQKQVIDLKKEVDELRERVDKLIKLMEKQNEKEKTEKINRPGK